ncbi:MAG: hypothetical protein QM742_01160 [Aquabacterium sp.]
MLVTGSESPVLDTFEQLGVGAIGDVIQIQLAGARQQRHARSCQQLAVGTGLERFPGADMEGPCIQRLGQARAGRIGDIDHLHALRFFLIDHGIRRRHVGALAGHRADHTGAFALVLAHQLQVA